MKKIALFLVLILTLAWLPLAMAAQQEDVWTMAKSDQYGKKVGGMLGRGLVNAATCFVDLIVQTVNGTKEGPPFVGTLTGLGGGLACTALRATSGVLDIATFWVPGFNGLPVSRSYSNCLEFEKEEMEAAPQELAPASEPYAPPARQPEDYAKPAAPAKHNTLDYVKK